MSLMVARLITPMVAAYFLKAHGEAKHGEGFEETPKRRFRHSEAYLRQVTERAGLKFLHISPSTLRFESGMPVAGFTVAVQK